MRKIREVKFEGGVKLYKCSSCGEFLPRERYSQNLAGYDFITSECKKCNNIRIKKYRSENKDKRNEYQRNYKAKRRMMMEAQFGEGYKVVPIPEPTYPQPGPQQIPAVQPKGLSAHQSQSDGVGEPTYPQPEPVPAVVSVNFDNKDITLTPSINKEPVITNNIDTTKTYTAVSKKEAEISNRLSSFTDRVKKEAEELEKEQIDYEKEYPDAYQKIMSDENYSRAFNYNYTEEQKLDALKREQALLDKKKEEFDYKSDLDKMRAMCDSLLEGDEKKRFEQAVSSLSGERQDKFVHRLGKLPTHQFKNNWKNIYDNILELKNGEKKEKDVIL